MTAELRVVSDADAQHAALAALVAELRRFVTRIDKYERQGWPERTQVSTLLPLRDKAKAVLEGDTP